jgi:hypothetical protein
VGRGRVITGTSPITSPPRITNCIQHPSAGYEPNAERRRVTDPQPLPERGVGRDPHRGDRGISGTISTGTCAGRSTLTGITIITPSSTSTCSTRTGSRTAQEQERENLAVRRHLPSTRLQRESGNTGLSGTGRDYGTKFKASRGSGTSTTPSTISWRNSRTYGGARVGRLATRSLTTRSRQHRQQTWRTRTQT